jgi:phage tail-like protein
MSSSAPHTNGSRNGKALMLSQEPSRGLIEGLPTPHPFGPALPSVFQEDDFAQRFVSAFDDVLAPIFCALDNWDAYLDPSVAPEDFLEWLSSWVGVELDETWPIERRRMLVSKAVELYRWRGTVKGLRDTVAIYTNSEPEIVDNGGIVASTSPGTKFPGKPGAEVTIKVKVKDPSTIDTARLERLVQAAKPAHVAATVSVTAG